MPRPFKLVKDQTLKEWLGEFKPKGTKKVYCAALRKFKEALEIKDLGKYIQSNPDTSANIKQFTAHLKGKSSMTIKIYVSAVRVFLQDHDLKLEAKDWQKLRRRGHVPKRAKPETRDKKPSKEQLKSILNHVTVKGRALFLFLLSSGCRIGETLQLNTEDLDLDVDPQRAFIKGEYTKGGVGERTVFFSYEARDALKDWLQIKDTVGKRDGNGTYKGEKIFGFGYDTAIFMWNNACDKANIGIKDKRTRRRLYHLHSLRKYFRTTIGLDLDITHSLMGHVQYLDESYLRQELDDIAESYKRAMSNVSVYEIIGNKELQLKTDTIEEENRKLKEKLLKTDARMEQIESLLVRMMNSNNNGDKF